MKKSVKKRTYHHHFKYGLLFLLIGVIFIASSYLLYFFCSGPKICYQETCFSIKIANTVESRQQGLMNVSSLAANRGMLFVFDRLDIHPFRMKNTLIPLDIVWLDHDLQVVDIQSAEPCTTSVCKSYFPTALAQYVLEINGGIAEKIGLKAGGTMIFSK